MYYSCATCHHVNAWESPHRISCNCGENFCSTPSCSDIKVELDSTGGYTTCKICRREEIPDIELLEFILRSHNSSRKEAEEAYRTFHEKDT